MRTSTSTGTPGAPRADHPDQAGTGAVAEHLRRALDESAVSAPADPPTPRSASARRSRRREHRLAMIGLSLAAGCAAALGGCADGGDQAASTTAETTVTVYAAASLTDSFTELGEQYEQAHPGTTVRFSFGGSSGLVSQLQEGAAADVLATADERNMTKAADAGLVDGDPETFARNVLEIVTPPDDPAGIAQPADIARSGVRLVVCAEQVPCGAATRALAGGLGVTLHPVSEENAVTDVLGKVTSGEADAGVVYVTDARGAGDAVREVPIPDDENVTNTYPIARLADAPAGDAADDFIAFVRSDDGQRVLADHGFQRAA